MQPWEALHLLNDKVNQDTFDRDIIDQGHDIHVIGLSLYNVSGVVQIDGEIQVIVIISTKGVALG